MKNNKTMKKISTLSILGILGATVLSGSLMTFAASSSYIGVEKAKAIALKDAKVSDVTFVKVKLDTEDGVKVYDVEFYKGNVEYDYEIDAITGQIREKDLDIENYTIPQKKVAPKKDNTQKQSQNQAQNQSQAQNQAQTQSQNYSGDIGAERAKSIALSDAGVSGVSFTKVKLDYEDGVKVYEVEFYKDNVEYDYEIDAATGSIRERSVEEDD